MHLKKKLFAIKLTWFLYECIGIRTYTINTIIFLMVTNIIINLTFRTNAHNQNHE